MGQTLRRWVKSSVVGSYPLSLGHTLRRWVMPSVIGLYPPSLVFTILCWVLRSVVGLCPSSFVGSVLHRWAVPSTIGFGAPSLLNPRGLMGAVSLALGATYRRWALRVVLGRYLALGSLCTGWAMHLTTFHFLDPPPFPPPISQSTGHERTGLPVGRERLRRLVLYSCHFVLSCRVVPRRFVSCRTPAFCIVSYPVVLYRVVPRRFVSCRTPSFCVVSCRTPSLSSRLVIVPSWW